jgi:hypothetical protein
MEMRTQNCGRCSANTIAPTLNLLHHNNIGVTYARISNFKMEPIKFVPLYFMAIP